MQSRFARCAMCTQARSLVVLLCFLCLPSVCYAAVQGHSIASIASVMSDTSAVSIGTVSSAPSSATPSPEDGYLQARVQRMHAERLEQDMADLKRYAVATGAAQRKLTLRWWELGVLAMEMGWRTKDQMESVRFVSACICESSEPRMSCFLPYATTLWISDAFRRGRPRWRI